MDDKVKMLTVIRDDRGEIVWVSDTLVPEYVCTEEVDRIKTILWDARTHNGEYYYD
jgi:hypothetical protein